MERRENQGQRAERDNKRPNSRPKFNRERREEADDLQKKLVCINRVTKGFEKALIVNGVGYKAQVQGKKLILNIGY